MSSTRRPSPDPPPQLNYRAAIDDRKASHPDLSVGCLTDLICGLLAFASWITSLVFAGGAIFMLIKLAHAFTPRSEIDPLVTAFGSIALALSAAAFVFIGIRLMKSRR